MLGDYFCVVNSLFRKSIFLGLRYACLLMMSLTERVLRNYVDKRRKEDECRTKLGREQNGGRRGR